MLPVTARNRGISLVEVLAIVAIAAIGMATAVWQLNQARQGAQLQDMASLQAQEMGRLADAAMRYGDANKTSLAAGAAYSANPSVLVSAKFLDAGFAYRNGVTGTSPMGQGYRAAGLRDVATGAIQVIVWTDGARAAAPSTRAGLAAGSAGDAQLSQAVMNAMAARDRTWGQIAAATTVAADRNGGFAIDVSAWLQGATPSVMTPAVLDGLAILGQAKVPPNPTIASSGNCNVVMPTAGNAPAMCPANQTSMATWPVCPGNNKYVTWPWSVYGTQAGIVVIGASFEAPVRAWYPDCWFGPFAPYCGGNYATFDQTVDGVVVVNAALIHTDGNCAGWHWMNQGGTIKQVFITNATVETFKANAIAALCCTN